MSNVPWWFWAALVANQLVWARVYWRLFGELIRLRSAK